MSLIPSLYPAVPGVYRVANTMNGQAYVGQTQDLRKRCAGHKNSLKAGKGSPLLQADYDKHGESIFWFEVLERFDGSVERSFLVEREAFWIEKLSPHYNVLSNPRSTPEAPSAERASRRERYQASSLITGYPEIDPVIFCEKVYGLDCKEEWNARLADLLEIPKESVDEWGEDFHRCPTEYRRSLLLRKLELGTNPDLEYWRAQRRKIMESFSRFERTASA